MKYMNNVLHTIADYLVNALRSAVIGDILAIAIVLAQGGDSVTLESLVSYAVVGITGGTFSKAAIEGAYALFGKRKALAYLLNALIVAIVILGFSYLIMGGMDGLPPLVIFLIFAIPEIASVILVHAELDEAESVAHAFLRRSDELTETDEQEGRGQFIDDIGSFMLRKRPIAPFAGTGGERRRIV
jgi:hypothetical protein